MFKKILLPVMIFFGLGLAVWAMVVTPEEIQEKRVSTQEQPFDRSVASE